MHSQRRALSCDQQAVLALRSPIDCTRPIQLTADDRIGRSTAHGVRASIDVLVAARRPRHLHVRCHCRVPKMRRIDGGNPMSVFGGSPATVAPLRRRRTRLLNVQVVTPQTSHARPCPRRNVLRGF
jgi:hypothetical protein